MQWPNYFPDDCPPEDSVDANGDVYRFVEKEIAKEKDFRSYRQKSPQNDFADKKCLACGLSIYKDVKDVMQLRERIPAFKKRKIAKGTLTSKFGVMIHTPSMNANSHCTWWVAMHMEPWKVFKVIDFPELY